MPSRAIWQTQRQVRGIGEFLCVIVFLVKHWIMHTSFHPTTESLRELPKKVIDFMTAAAPYVRDGPSSSPVGRDALSRVMPSVTSSMTPYVTPRIVGSVLRTASTKGIIQRDSETLTITLIVHVSIENCLRFKFGVFLVKPSMK